jgi:hypothetical protein
MTSITEIKIWGTISLDKSRTKGIFRNLRPFARKCGRNCLDTLGSWKLLITKKMEEAAYLRIHSWKGGRPTFIFEDEDP